MRLSVNCQTNEFITTQAGTATFSLLPAIPDKVAHGRQAA